MNYGGQTDITIDQLIDLLNKQRVVLGGDAKVAAMWDCALSALGDFGVYKGSLILCVSDYASSDLEWDYLKFEYAD